MGLMRKIHNLIAPLFVIAGVVILVASAARSPVAGTAQKLKSSFDPREEGIIRDVDQWFEQKWQEVSIEPAPLADELTVFRRLSLVLHGTIPSLEEIRLFNSDHQSERLERWAARLLADRRFADYFARRLSRVFIGIDQGQLLVFRRDRFWSWLSDQLQANRPYDEIVREKIAGRGLWTDMPQVNFVAAAVTDGNIDYNKLAGRTARAFLGQRLDCAECHNHPFAEWKQAQFLGLAACFGNVSLSAVGIEDNKKDAFKVTDRLTLRETEVVPQVPFHPEWMPDVGTTRQRLGGWVTHRDNRRFDRAIVNRIWGLMFGKAWIEPVDDIASPDESGSETDDLLDLLAADFRLHGRELKWLISTLASTRVFRQSSQHSAFDTGERASEIERAWAAFPMTRLRPEQVIGAMLQASSIKTVDQNSHWTIRAIRFIKELDFVKEYGDLGEDELTERAGTIPQALLRMNSEFSAEWTRGTIFSAAGRIAGMSIDDEACLESCFLVCLTRYPTAEERSLLRPQFAGVKGSKRTDVVEDLFWSLFNSPEFCWEY